MRYIFDDSKAYMKKSNIVMTIYNFHKKVLEEGNFTSSIEENNSKWTEAVNISGEAVATANIVDEANNNRNDSDDEPKTIQNIKTKKNTGNRSEDEEISEDENDSDEGSTDDEIQTRKGGNERDVIKQNQNQKEIAEDQGKNSKKEVKLYIQTRLN
jgi:hypothetical protein